jgi:hypothetical protein
MSGKVGCGETAKPQVDRGPDGMVKPTLVEPECPSCKWNSSDTAGDIRGPMEPRRRNLVGVLVPNGQGHVDDLKGTKWAPTAVLIVIYARNAGSPNGREPHGDGAPIVVRGRESRPHGEGGQEARVVKEWRYA